MVVVDFYFLPDENAREKKRSFFLYRKRNDKRKRKRIVEKNQKIEILSSVKCALFKGTRNETDVRKTIIKKSY